MTSEPSAAGGPPRWQRPEAAGQPPEPRAADAGRSGAATAGDKPAPPPRATRAGVKRGLTLRRARRVTENDEYAAFARRVLRAWARRVAAGDIDAIVDMAASAAELDVAIGEAVTGLRAKGYSWADIGARLGVTRQAAQQRWG